MYTCIHENGGNDAAEGNWFNMVNITKSKSGMLGVALPLDFEKPRCTLQHTSLDRETRFWYWWTYRCV